MLFKYNVLQNDNVFPRSYKEAKEMFKVLGVEYICTMPAPMIVFYIEMNMKTKRYVQNVGMTSR